MGIDADAERAAFGDEGFEALAIGLDQFAISSRAGTGSRFS
jgi:hypothetical protein